MEDAFVEDELEGDGDKEEGVSITLVTFECICERELLL